MTPPNHYTTLNISPTATHAEVKQAYRKLVKQCHPDCNQNTANPEQIRRVNAAYEVLGDPQRRSDYDQGIHHTQWQEEGGDRQERMVVVQEQYRRHRQTEHNINEQFIRWVQQVYYPVTHQLTTILDTLDGQIDELAADPFDDQLMAVFQEYLQNCRHSLGKAQVSFRSMPNPSMVAGVAAHLYHCLNQTADGLDELEYFTLNYDDSHLHVGYELFRIADTLFQDAEGALQHLV